MNRGNTRERKKIILIWTILSIIVSSLLFYLSDSADKRYLNPVYVDVLALGFGAYLVMDAIASDGDFYSRVIRAIIGGSLATIHTMQFAFDFVRYG